MQRMRSVVVGVIVATATASAQPSMPPPAGAPVALTPPAPEPPRIGLVAAGGAIMLGVGSPASFVGVLEGAVRPIPRLPLFAHAQGTRGSWESEGGFGKFSTVRAGTELFGCSHSTTGLCGFVDLDLGYRWVTGVQRTTQSGDSLPVETLKGVMWGGGLGIDAGWTTVRIRVAITFERALTGHWTAYNFITSSSFGASGGLQAELGYAF
jgi:hypothetical protein